MRDIVRYPVTKDEIIQQLIALKTPSNTPPEDLPVGNMRDCLIDAAIEAVVSWDMPKHWPLRFKDKDD